MWILLSILLKVSAFLYFKYGDRLRSNPEDKVRKEMNMYNDIFFDSKKQPTEWTTQESNKEYLAISYCENFDKVSIVRRGSHGYIVSVHSPKLKTEFQVNLIELGYYENIDADGNICTIRHDNYIHHFYHFKVYHDKSIIEIVSEFEYSILDNKNNTVFESYISLVHYDFSGKMVESKKLLKRNVNDFNTNVLYFNNGKNFIFLNLHEFGNYPLNLLTFGINTKLNLLDRNLYSQKEEYEYYYDLTFIHRKLQLAFICKNNESDIQGIKILEIKSDNSISCVYDLDEIEPANTFHKIAFNKEGNKFIVLTSAHESVNYSLLEYSIFNRSPKKLYNTNINIDEDMILSIHYLNNSFVCFVTSYSICVYSLISESKKKVFLRDYESAYLISENKIYYFHKGKFSFKAFS